MNRYDIHSERQKLRERMAELEQQEKQLENLSPGQRLADLIHGATCRANHTDGCGYEYSKWGEGGDAAKRRYLDRAEKVIAVLSEQDLDWHLESEELEEFVAKFIRAVTGA